MYPNDTYHGQPPHDPQGGYPNSPYDQQPSGQSQPPQYRVVQPRKQTYQVHERTTDPVAIRGGVTMPVLGTVVAGLCAAFIVVIASWLPQVTGRQQFRCGA